MSWLSKTQVVAARNVDNVLSGVNRRLIQQLHTCTRDCASDSDCDDCWVCCNCTSVLNTQKTCTAITW